MRSVVPETQKLQYRDHGSRRGKQKARIKKDWFYANLFLLSFLIFDVHTIPQIPSGPFCEGMCVPLEICR